MRKNTQKIEIPAGKNTKGLVLWLFAFSFAQMSQWFDPRQVTTEFCHGCHQSDLNQFTWLEIRNPFESF